MKRWNSCTRWELGAFARRYSRRCERSFEAARFSYSSTTTSRSRTGRDSNPRVSCPTTRFPGVRLKPLGHLSLNCSEKREARSEKRSKTTERASRFPLLACFHGQGGIRTHDTVTGIPVFETGSFSHSDTCPNRAKYCSRSEIRSQREHRADLPRLSRNLASVQLQHARLHPQRRQRELERRRALIHRGRNSQ